MLQQVSLQFFPGQIYALLGPNGAGKTTLQKIIRGSLQPSAGQVRVLGQNPKVLRDGRHEMAWLSDQPAVHARLKVGELLQFYAGLFGVPCRAPLREVGLEGLEGRYCGQLSRGQQQRLGWARALMTGARLLLLDEPTSGLDLASKERIHELLQRFVEGGGAALLSTHDMLEAQQLAHCVGILERGQLLDQDSPGELCRRHLDQELETSSAQPSLEKVYRKLTGNSLTQFGS